MNPDIVENLLWIVFRGSMKCIFCRTICGNGQEKLIHIYNKHSSFWSTAISKFKWVMEILWHTCFRHYNNRFKCKHCIEKFYTEDRRLLHKHMVTKHPIVLLSYTILYNKM